MRLLSAVLLSILVFGAVARRWPKGPKLVNVQINRCPTPTIYANEWEEETVISNPNKETGKVFLRSEFEDTVRMLANESGTIQFFLVGNGSYTVTVKSDQKVLKGVHGVFNIKEGGVITLPFEVLSSVRETEIDIITDSDIVEKDTIIYISTMSLEPPRPPTRYSSLLFTEAELETMAAMEPNSPNPRSGINQDVEISTTDVNASATDGTLKNITNSPSVIERLPAPPVKSIFQNETGEKKNFIVLENITFNRISINKATVYEYPSNVYNNCTISKFENGQIVFNVKGNGKLTVTIWSLVEQSMAAKVMQVVNGYAAFPYNDGLDYVDVDKLIAKIHNDRNEKLYVYLTVRRVE